MKTFVLLIAAALLCGCKAKPVTSTHNPASIVTKRISLKDVTTGIAPGAALIAGYSAEWSYFGKKRVVEHTTDHAGLVTSIKFNLGSDFEGRQVQEELEKKLSEENGKKVAFDCLTSFSPIVALDNMNVTRVLCTIRSDTQTLTLRRVRPTNEQDANKYPDLSTIYDNTEVMLIEPGLESARVAADRNKADLEIKASEQRAKSDI